MFRLIVVMLFFAVPVLTADFIKTVGSSNPVYGDKLSSSELKGKVILLEYWGTN